MAASRWPPPGDTQIGLFEIASGLLMSTAASSLGKEAAEEAVDKTLGSFERSDLCDCRGARSDSFPPCYKCSASPAPDLTIQPPSYRRLHDTSGVGDANHSRRVDGNRQIQSAIGSVNRNHSGNVDLALHSPERGKRTAHRSASSPGGYQFHPTDPVYESADATFTAPGDSARRRSNLETLMEVLRSSSDEGANRRFGHGEYSSAHSLSRHFGTSDSLLPSVLFIPK